MNREGRAKLRKVAEKFNRECLLSTSEFIRVTEALHDEEEEKLDRFPDQLRNSDKGGQIGESKGHKGTSFHAIFPSVLMDRLKNSATRRGLSMNKIVCRALTNELSNETV